LFLGQQQQSIPTSRREGHWFSGSAGQYYPHCFFALRVAAAEHPDLPAEGRLHVGRVTGSPAVPDSTTHFVFFAGALMFS